MFLLSRLSHQHGKPVQESVSHRVESTFAAFGVNWEINEMINIEANQTIFIYYQLKWAFPFSRSGHRCSRAFCTYQ